MRPPATRADRGEYACSLARSCSAHREQAADDELVHGRVLSQGRARSPLPFQINATQAGGNERLPLDECLLSQLPARTMPVTLSRATQALLNPWQAA